MKRSSFRQSTLLCVGVLPLTILAAGHATAADARFHMPDANASAGLDSLSIAGASHQADSPVRIRAQLDRSTAAVADPIELRLTVEAPADVAVALPQSGDTLGPFEVIDVRDVADVPIPDGRQWTRRYLLESIETGQHTVPEISVAYVDRRGDEPISGEVRSRAMPVEIQTLLAETDQPTEFRDIKNAVWAEIPETQVASSPVAAIVISSLLGMAAVCGLIWFCRPLTPRKWALRMLDRLENSGDAMDGNYEQVYESAANVLREFLFRRMELSVPWLTTPEFLEQAQQDRRLSESVRQQLENFLNSVDMVKFAALSCDRDLLKKAMDKARSFVVDCDACATRMPMRERDTDLEALTETTGQFHHLDKSPSIHSFAEVSDCQCIPSSNSGN
jgi:hypothetical protein